MESFFPPFYFTYFIVALAIVAVVHEFSHGIYMKLFKVKIKSTGLVFLGPILGAFVEQDDKSFKKKKDLEQMTILGAGVFANLLFALIFYLLYVLFFFTSFTATGYVFNTYGVSAVPIDTITGFEEYGNLTKVTTNTSDYYLDANLATQLDQDLQEYLLAYPESPAALLQIRGAIIRMDNTKILNEDDLRAFLEDKEPGDRVSLTTITEEGEEQTYSFELSKHPLDETKPYLGVGNNRGEARGVIQKLLVGFMSFKDPTTQYTPSWDGDFVYFIYHLLWWVMIINLLVALFNMLPLGMLDGGRFFYLLIRNITRSKKAGKYAYKLATWGILFIFLLLMFFWFIRII